MSNSTSLPRTTSTTDLSKLFRIHHSPSRRSRSRRSYSVSKGRESECNGSENSQILYMAPPRNGKRHELSSNSTGNGTGRRLGGSLADRAPGEEDQAAEELSFDVIDREILEWQHVCHTSRPYWWAPGSRHRQLQSILFKKPRLWMGEINDRPQATCGFPRRVVSDSFLTDTNTVHDLAQIIAVQLLGACFTLPPDHVPGVPPPIYEAGNKAGLLTALDPRMISSLRMHTHFRYSPSFGHEAPNTSPVQNWPVNSPSPRSPVRRGETADGEPPGKHSIRRRYKRSPKGLGSSSRKYSNSECAESSPTSQSEADHNPTSKGIVCTQFSEQGASCRTAKIPTRPSDRRSQNSSVGVSKDQLNDSQAHAIEERNNDSREIDSGVQPCKQPPKLNYRLQPVIRSEPHAVFVQPVKELVVKRWRTLRRRFGGSLHSPLPLGTMRYNSTLSGSEGSSPSSPGRSSDARLRRRRAQERGDIHSSSIESIPHYNSPASGSVTPLNSGGTHSWVDSTDQTSTFRLLDPLMAASSLAAGEMGDSRNSINPLTSWPSDTESVSFISPRLTQSSSVSATCGSSHVTQPRTEFPFPSKVAWTVASHNFASSKRMDRTRRAHALSEVCTPGDFIGAVDGRGESDGEPAARRALSPIGSTLASSNKEGLVAPPIDRRTNASTPANSPDSSIHIAQTGRRDFATAERPRLSRTSTSGTQVFTPDEDGVEIDGLPAGPSKDVWALGGTRH